MAIAVDTTWARATATGAKTVTTASHTPAAGTLLLAMGSGNSDFGEEVVPTLSGGSLVWTKIVENTGPASSAFNGIAVAYWAIASGAALTVIFSTTSSLNDISVKMLKVTGAHATVPVGATLTGTSVSNSFTTAGYTSTVDNSRGFAVFTDWALTTPAATSSDSIDAFSSTGIAGAAVYKAANTTPAASSVTFNIDWGGAGASETVWGSFEIVPAAAVVGDGSMESFELARRRRR